LPAEGSLPSGVFGVTSLFIYISYNIKAKCMRVGVRARVCVAAGEEIDIHTDIFTTHLLTP